ncbi:uncharacterized protein BJX67DRAFT_356613 [Aspergillus lucknowensis]|uniref:Secreted protein n=1 Tax=Aspergillus lucknowensis TaxID=176173 RepID=A0ABR4LNJ4_9EURO
MAFLPCRLQGLLYALPVGSAIWIKQHLDYLLIPPYRCCHKGHDLVVVARCNLDIILFQETGRHLSVQCKACRTE